MELQTHHINRWAVSDGDLTVPNVASSSASITCGGASEEVPVENGIASVSVAKALSLMPDLGIYLMVVHGDGTEARSFTLERVESRYTSRGALIAYGRQNNDAFDDEALYPPSVFSGAIQRAEEAIEQACKRSFTTRKRKCRLFVSRLCELPEVDVVDIDCDIDGVELVSDRQATGITRATMATITYGAPCPAMISEAATRLAASYLRPRVGAENARGTASDGVYVSYTLATGDEGSWTGIPYVDAAIEEYRSRRVIVA